METRTLRIFQGEINKQCEFALISAESIQHTLNNLQRPNAGKHFWYFIQNFLISTANISKILWGSNEFLEKQREPLRESLGVLDDSLLKSKKVRNLFEHLDEKIDLWQRKSKSHNFIDSNIAPLEMFDGTFEKKDIFRHFDPETLHLTFWNEVYEIQPIVKELVELKRITSIEGSKPHWK